MARERSLLNVQRGKRGRNRGERKNASGRKIFHGIKIQRERVGR